MKKQNKHKQKEKERQREKKKQPKKLDGIIDKLQIMNNINTELNFLKLTSIHTRFKSDPIKWPLKHKLLFSSPHKIKPNDQMEHF